MGVIDSSNPEIRNLKGLHLYHYATSNCSQKTRMCLEEKGLPWTSHHVDLARHEQATPEYVSINPKGLVPTLVHDGVVIVESSDIIDYIDQTFPYPPLRPTDPRELDLMYQWLKLWDETQISLRTLSHFHLFKQRAAAVRPKLARFEALIKDDGLIAFLREFTSEQGLSQHRVEKATEAVGKTLARLNSHLDGCQWLAGGTFSLADIAWSVDIHRFQLTQFPMDRYHALLDWYGRVESRPSFQRMVLDYEKQVLKILTG